MPAPPIAAHRRAGRLDPVRLGVRMARQVGPSGAEPPDTRNEFAADALTPGVRRVGPVELTLGVEAQGDAATFDWRVRNASDAEIQLETAVLGLRWTELPPGAGTLRFLRHGWQSWSYTGVRDLDAAGEPPFPSGPWLRGLHHGVGAPPSDRQGWHESDAVSVAGAGSDGAVCLAGVLETGREFGLVYLRPSPDGGGVDVELEVRVEAVLAPGEERRLESLRVALDTDASRLLERFAELWGRRAGARTGAPFQAGWCSWYHFFHDVTEDDLLRNLDVLARERGEFPIDVVQLDDGYQREIGDWLDTNEKFPRGLGPVAADIAAAGFRPGIWTAPFCVVPESRLHAEHPAWLLRQGDELFPALIHPEWTPSGWVRALDTTQEPVLEHLRRTFASLREMGFVYQKIDFLHAACMRADSADPRVTRAERLRRGLDAVREGAGDDAFVLGCGCPMGPAVGLVDGMRIGPDVAPHWEFPAEAAIPGLEPALPATGSAIRSIVHRAWMHRRLWLNDPDCLMARSRDTQLAPEEVRSLAASIGATGGMLVFSDDLGSLADADRACIRETLEAARAVDGLGSRGAARAIGLLDGATALVARGARDTWTALLNTGDGAATRRVALETTGVPAPVPRLGSPEAKAEGDGLEVALASHESGLYRLAEEAPGRVAVFCDFDGTFSVQDVGSTIARERAPERRPAQWARYERGEITAWEYNLEILDGLELPEKELDDFLHTIELDPGASALVDWCATRGVPFRILSDGFDHNLDVLQRIHRVRFEYQANGLRYAKDRWKLTPGHPDPECFCGTGTCKRQCIARWRRSHPGAYCVHVGNGRVSDLCGALEADLTFAKDTLAPALEARGIAYEPFSTLHDVVGVLEARLA